VSWLTERLATLMPERGLTVDALARQLAIERSRLNAIVAGTALPNDNLLRRVARIFGENPEEWLVHVREPATAPPLPELRTGFVKVAGVAEIADGEMKVVCNGLVVVANARGGFHAFGNICPHAEGPLGDGFLDGLVIECPWHNGQWDITTGKGLTAFATADIPLFEVRVVGDDIEVRLPGSAPGSGEGLP
jgi:naphthalene 1,2-dioxygenase ferredoxin component